MRLVCEKCVVSSSLRSFKKEDLLNFKIVEVENQIKQHELAVFYIIQKAFILPIVGPDPHAKKKQKVNAKFVQSLRQ